MSSLYRGLCCVFYLLLWISFGTIIKNFLDYQVDPICAHLHCVYIDPPLTAALLTKSPVILLIMSSRASPLWMSVFLFKKKKKKKLPVSGQLWFSPWWRVVIGWAGARLLLWVISSLVKTSWGNAVGNLSALQRGALWRGTLCRKGKYKQKNNY